MRYAFITLKAAPNVPGNQSKRAGLAATPVSSVTFTIKGVRAVVQTKAVNYEGSFTSPSDPMIEQVWWVAAYTVRANLLRDAFGSILMDRGDREASDNPYWGWGNLHLPPAPTTCQGCCCVCRGGEIAPVCVCACAHVRGRLCACARACV